jgi:hypothetical protein
MAEKNQHELAVEAGKTLMTETLLFDPIVMEGTDSFSPVGKWRENEPIQWNQELAVWEYKTDANVFTCSRLNPDADARGN